MQRVSTPTIDKTELTIYPNPAHSYLYFGAPIESKSDYRIFSTVGQLVKYGQVENDNIPVQNLPNGVYNLIISSAGSEYDMRFLKE